MNLSYHIAKRYLFSKKSHNAVNIISIVAVCGIAVATMATICTLSVFNGFRDLWIEMFGAFDPELKITPVEGKVFDPETDLFIEIKSMPEIALVSESLEDNAMLSYRDREAPIVLKGVENQFALLTDFESLLIGGDLELERETNNYSLLGLGLANSLTVNHGFVYPMQLFTVKRKATIELSNPYAAIIDRYVYIGGVFRTNQAVYDNHYLIVPLRLARELFDYEKEVSALEIRLKPGASIHDSQSKIQAILGDDYHVKNRYQQQEDSFRMVSIEKWVSFLMLCFIILIAIFNITGSLSILIMEKQSDMITLRNMGANEKLISRIFLFEGWMISAIGGGVGIVSGILLCLGQQHFGWLKLGTGDNFAVDAYPVSVTIGDVLFTIATVSIIGFLAVLSRVRYLINKWLVL